MGFFGENITIKLYYSLKKILTNPDSCSILKIQVGLYPAIGLIFCRANFIEFLSGGEARRQSLTSDGEKYIIIKIRISFLENRFNKRYDKRVIKA